MKIVEYGMIILHNGSDSGMFFKYKSDFREAIKESSYYLKKGSVIHITGIKIKYQGSERYVPNIRLYVI